MRFGVVILIILMMFPFFASAAGADLYITSEDIRFSKEILFVGDTVRLYARIHNASSDDVLGYVTFYQGQIILGNSQVISLLGGGAVEEVYIDFVVPSGSFNIRAEIRGTDPVDANPDNNTAITAMIEPTQDSDRDNVADSSDNCPKAKNTDQVDTDKDGLGDVCDDDDDNDGLSDSVESELGSNPLEVDTDKDTVPDFDDAFPNDSSKKKITDVVKQPKTTAVSQTFSKIVNKVAETIQENQKQDGQKTEQTINVAPLTFSPNAVFVYSKINWNTFSFRILSPTDDTYQYEWNFGDGVKSNKTEVTHTYQHSGSYSVGLIIHDENDQISKETTTVLVPFFSLQNKMVVMLVVLLLILLVSDAWALIVCKRSKSVADFEQHV